MTLQPRRSMADDPGCPNVHIINRDDDRFWITCGDDTIATEPLSRFDGRSHIDVHQWAERVIARHTIAWLQAEVKRLRALTGTRFTSG